MKFKKAPTIPENSRLKSIASGTAEVFKLDPRHITREPHFNNRYDFGDLQLLADDIEANGVLESLKVRKEGTTVYLVNGDRRLSAIELLIRDDRWPADPKNPGYPMPVPCTSEGVGVKPLDRIFLQLSLNTGKPFTLLEKGLAYRDILKLAPEICASEIARRSGETKQAVSNALTLANDASAGLIEHIMAGTMAASTALEIVKAHDTHLAQDEAAAAALKSAADNGHQRATPKDLPAKPQKTSKETQELWEYDSSPDHAWNAEGSSQAPNLVTATGLPRFGISRLCLYASEMPNGTWRHCFSFQTKDSGATGQPSTTSHSHPDESHAFLAAWRQIAVYLIDYATSKKTAPLTQSGILSYAKLLGQSLHAKFPTGQDADDSLFDLNPPANDDDDDGPEPVIEDHSKDNSPADPSAFERLKNAPSSNRDGSGTGGPGGGFATPDKRLKNIEELLDSIDPTTVNQNRWDTMELVLDYLNGNHTIATLRTHLTESESN